MTTKELTIQESFQENIKNRLRQDIGDLIPDSVLQEMVKKSINEMFFTRANVKESYHTTKIENSWFDNEIQKLLTERVNTTLTNYFKDNEKKLTEAVAEEITKSAPSLIAAFFINTLNNQSINLACNLTNDINNNLRNKGLII